MKNIAGLSRVFDILILITLCSSYDIFERKTKHGTHVAFNDTYEYGKDYSIVLNSSVEFVLEYGDMEYFDTEYPARIFTASDDSNRTFPIFITARQQKGVQSWQLPLVLDDRELHTFSRTLCPNKNFFLQASKTFCNGENGETQPNTVQNHPIIHIYTSSLTNITLKVRVDLVNDFYLKLNSAKNITTSPSEPRIYFYSFEYGALDNLIDLDAIRTTHNTVNYDGKAIDIISDLATNDTKNMTTYDKTKQYFLNFARETLQMSILKKLNETMKTVLISLESDDDTCMLISIQNASCPVFDNERDILYEGYYATISRRGGISVTQKNFPWGFYIVLAVKSSDEDCNGGTEININRTSNHDTFFNWEQGNYGWAGSDQKMSHDRSKHVIMRINPSISYQDYWIATISGLLAIVVIYLVFLIGLICCKFKALDMSNVDNRGIFLEGNGSPLCTPDVPHSTLDSFHNNYGIRRTSYTSLGGRPVQAQIFLDELCTRDLNALQRQSTYYLWHLLTVAVFYGLPVVQLVITYQRILNQTGNQDLCYYNFLCAHSLGQLSDFNHVYSNLGYVLLGALFLVITWRRKRRHCDDEFDQTYGIPQHYGLYYAMGYALIMEGVLSGSYHVCPNHSNFQFDTSFMYIMAVLCMVKIYQTRHPDINARAHSTFGVLAAVVTIGLFGVLYPNFYFWIFFTIIHIGTCLLLTLQIYYMGKWSIGCNCLTRCICGGLCMPALRSRCVLVFLANLCNWGLAAYGMYEHSKDFATHLLWVFLMNLALYLTFYFNMKLAHGERPPLHTCCLLLLSMIAWGSALKFFLDNSISWALTPAQSRVYNKPCALMGFYDNHDIWHLLSAAAMFFSFMLLLTLDDDLTHTPRWKIPVF